jgi:peptidoglycan/LPS O-acetylase OafA/YrhL
MIASHGSVATADGAIENSQRSAREEVYYPWFDWLRFGLSLLVLFYHEGLYHSFHVGHLAIQIFFALSGWLIGDILIRLKKEDLPRFYFNRAFRIWCPYILAVALLLGVSIHYDHITLKWAEIVFYYVTFVYNIFGIRQLGNHIAQMPLHGTGNHFWSVAAEEQFYLIAPLLLVVLPPRIGRSIVLWIVLCLAALKLNMDASIAFGVLAALLAHSLGPFQDNIWFRAGAGVVAAITGVAMALGASYDLLSPFFAIAFVLFLAIKGQRHRFGEIAGGLSYPLYLNQWTSWVVLKAVLHGRVLPFPGQFITIPAGIAFAALLYWYFDRVILASRKRLYTERRGRILMVLAYAAFLIGLCGGLMRWRHA